MEKLIKKQRQKRRNLLNCLKTPKEKHRRRFLWCFLLHYVYRSLVLFLCPIVICHARSPCSHFYQWDFGVCRMKNLQRSSPLIITSLHQKSDDDAFVEQLVRGVIDRRPQIDEVLTQFAPDWPLEMLTLIDRNILRLGVYELKICRCHSSKGCHQQAIELAKGFGDNQAVASVNGVLGAVYKDMVVKGG